MNKKILIIINNLGIGGAERLVVDDINEMLRIGVDVSLITLAPEPQKSFYNELKLPPEQRVCVPFGSFFNIFSWIKLLHAIRRLKPAMVITQLWYANTIGRIAARCVGVPIVLTFEQNVYDTVKTKKMFFVDWLLQNLSTKIIAVSQTVKKSLVAHSIKKSKIDVLYNSVDVSKFEVLNNIFNIKKEFHISDSAFVFVFIGRLIHQKAVDVLIRAFKTVSEDSHLIIVGQGREREKLENLVSKTDITSRVTFVGIRNDIPQLLLASGCFVLPSRYEGLPLVLAEACAAGVPIIVSDFEAAQEVIINEVNGLIVPREDSEKLATAMNRIVKDESLRVKLAAGAKKTSDQFSISHHVRAILRYTNELT